jgi:hypothetical protein
MLVELNNTFYTTKCIYFKVNYCETKVVYMYDEDHSKYDVNMNQMLRKLRKLSPG